MSSDKKPTKIEDLMLPKPEKKVSQISEHFLKKFKTKEEWKAWHAQATKKRLETQARKKAEKKAEQDELMSQARALAPQLLAQEILAEDLDNPNWAPRQDTIDKIKRLVKLGLSIDSMRDQHFRGIKDENWKRIVQFVFKSSTPSAESVGLEIRASFERNVIMLQEQLKEVKSEIRIYKRNNKGKNVAAYLLTMKHDIENKLLVMTQQMAKTMHEIGAVGEKSKSPIFHIHSQTPRPTKVEKVIEAIVEAVK